jgi:hypothetical protein
VRHRTLRLPRDLRPLVRETVATYARTVRSPSAARSAAVGPANAGTWTGGCPAARATGAYAPGQLRAAYGVGAAGAGAGASAAILNAGESVPRQDRVIAARCFGLPELRTRTLLTDGQARPFTRGFGDFEPQEDLALVRGMAPALRDVTFSQVWLAPELWFLGASQVLAAPRLPDVFSISYGECDRDTRGPKAPPRTRAGASLMDAVLVRLGLAGVGSFASAGDFGSTCNGQPYPGVAWPASSPFLTAVGGTRLTLNAANARTDEVVWNDLPWLSANNGGGAGGGGFAAVSARPPYQRGLAVGGGRRAVPDVSAHASSFPAYVAGAFAVLDAAERAAGRPPLGPVDGRLYANRADVFDVVSGANGYDPKVPALGAGPGYDLASGLGVPRFDRLAAAVPAPAP